MYPPKSTTVKVSKQHQFINQEMWEETPGHVVIGFSPYPTWIEAGWGDGWGIHVYPNKTSSSYTGWFWTDMRAASSHGASSYWLHRNRNYPVNYSKQYQVRIFPVAAHSWSISFSEKSSQGAKWLQKGTNEPSSGAGAYGHDARFGVENTCISNVTPLNVQAVGKKTYNSTNHSTKWVSYASTLTKSPNIGSHLSFQWKYKKAKFSTGT